MSSADKKAAPKSPFDRLVLGVTIIAIGGFLTWLFAVPLGAIMNFLVCGCLGGPETAAILKAGPPDTTLPGALSNVGAKGQVHWQACRRFPSGEVRQIAYSHVIGTLIIVPGGDCQGGIELPKPPTYAVYWAENADTSSPRIGAIDVGGCTRWKEEQRIQETFEKFDPEFAACWRKPTCEMTIATENLAGAAQVLREFLDDPEVSAPLKTAARRIAAAFVLPEAEAAAWLPPAVFDRSWVNNGDPPSYALCGWEAAAKVTAPFPPPSVTPPPPSSASPPS